MTKTFSNRKKSRKPRNPADVKKARSVRGPVKRQALHEQSASAVKDLEAPTAGRTSSKQARVLSHLADAKGSTIEAIAKFTGWQSHSIRGFFAGVVRKRLKLNLVSERVDGVRVYRIIDKVSARGETLS